MKIITVTLMILTIVGCKNQQTMAKNPSSDFVIIEESACEGSCPVYKMTIYTNGEANFLGIANTNETGEHTYKYSEAEAEALFEMLKLLNFKEFEEGESFIVDIPETKITYQEQSIIIKDVRKIPKEYKSLVETLKNMTRSTAYIN